MAAAVVALRRQRGTTTPTTAVESACGGQAYDRNVAGGMVDARQPCSHRTLRPPSGHKRYDRSGQNGYDGNAAVKPAASFPRHLDVGSDRSAAIRLQNPTPVRPTPEKPYDASSGKTTMPKKSVTMTPASGSSGV